MCLSTVYKNKKTDDAMSVPVCYPISYMTCSEKLQGVTINGGNCTFLLADAYFEG